MYAREKVEKKSKKGEDQPLGEQAGERESDGVLSNDQSRVINTKG